MLEHLVFHLEGQFASWCHDSSPLHKVTIEKPGKSAIAGILAGALGMDIPSKEYLKLATAMKVCIRLCRRPDSFIDYSTIQVPVASKGCTRHESRREQIVKGVHTGSVVHREVLCGASYTVSVRLDGFELREVFDALKKPVNAPFLGKKAYTLSWPVAPQIIQASDFAMSLQQYSHPLLALVEEECRFFWEGGLDEGFETVVAHRRRDQPASDIKRIFIERIEYEGRAV